MILSYNKTNSFSISKDDYYKFHSTFLTQKKKNPLKILIRNTREGPSGSCLHDFKGSELITQFLVFIDTWVGAIPPKQ